MKLRELKELIDFQVAHHPEANEWEVVIPNNKPSIGPRSVTRIAQAGGGIDWDKGKFFLFPEDRMCLLNNGPDITFDFNTEPDSEGIKKFKK